MPQPAHADLVEELERSRAQRADAQALARIGSWEIDVARDVVIWSDQLHVLLGVEPGAFRPSPEVFFDFVVDDDRVPIIALTASATAGERERCLAAGMDAFLTKPVEVDRLDAALAEQLGQPARATGSPRPIPSGGVLDTRRLDELVEMGEEALPLVQRAVDNFVAGAQTQVGVLRSAIADADADAEAARAAAHRLKGSALNLGAIRVGELAHELEQAGAERRLDRAGPMLERLALALGEVTAALGRYRLTRSLTS